MVFLFIILTIILLILILIFSKITIEIKNLKFQSRTERHINKNYEFIIKLYILKIFPIFKINITKEKLEKLKGKVQKLDLKLIQNDKQFNKKAITAVKELDIGIRKINLYVDLGTENASLTSILVPAISTFISIILRKKIKKFDEQIFIINPVYNNQNLVNIHISGIFEIKISHIINMIYILLNKQYKKGVNKNERTSNRRSYGYSYE